MPRRNLAWRMVIELVAGLGIGFGMGYGLDVLFGTLPVFLVHVYISGPCGGRKDDAAARRKEIQD